MRQGFAQVPNNVLWDPELSMKAKGLWAYIKSKPPYWDFAAERIARETKESRKSILAGLKELEAAGYLKRTKLPSGRVTHKIYPQVHKFPDAYEPPIPMETCVKEIQNITQMDKAQAIQSAQDFAKTCVEAEIKRSSHALRSWIQHHKP